jgi:prevent-host-death family protein
MSGPKAMKLSEARSSFSSVVNEVYRRRERVVVEKSGIPVAAIVPVADLERLQRFDAEREERFKVLDEIRAAFADVDPDELEREADKAIAEVRRKARAARIEREAS